MILKESKKFETDILFNRRIEIRNGSGAFQKQWILDKKIYASFSCSFIMRCTTNFYSVKDMIQTDEEAYLLALYRKQIKKILTHICAITFLR